MGPLTVDVNYGFGPQIWNGRAADMLDGEDGTARQDNRETFFCCEELVGPFGVVGNDDDARHSICLVED